MKGNHLCGNSFLNKGPSVTSLFLFSKFYEIFLKQLFFTDFLNLPLLIPDEDAPTKATTKTSENKNLS